jgi:hypothetical protein
MLNIVRNYLIDNKDVKFPLQLSGDGKFPAILNKVGQLRCPNCGNPTWTIYGYCHIKCNVCYNQYNNFGILGLEQIINKEEEEGF